MRTNREREIYIYVCVCMYKHVYYIHLPKNTQMIIKVSICVRALYFYMHVCAYVEASE